MKDASEELRSLELEIFAFDGREMAVRLTLNFLGDKTNQIIRVWYETGSSVPSGSFIQTKVEYSIGRVITDVAYSRSTNITTFRYRFSTPYALMPVGGIPIFPFDVHLLSFDLTGSFDPSISRRNSQVSSLPSVNYQWTITVQRLEKTDSDYRYQIRLELFHSEYFMLLSILLVWGVLALVLAIVLIVGRRIHRLVSGSKELDRLATVLSSILVFLPVYQLSLQPLKSPLPLVLADFAYVLTALLCGGFLAYLFIKFREPPQNCGHLQPSLHHSNSCVVTE